MDDVRPFPPRHKNTDTKADNLRKWRGRIFMIGIPLLLIVGSLLRFWVDLLWFEELGNRVVLVTRLQWGTLTGIIAGSITFLVLWLNFWLARKVARNDLYVPFLVTSSDDMDIVDQPTVPHFVLRPILLGVSAVAAVLSGIMMSSQWETILRFIGRSDFGVQDPHFHKDASFYVFTMPLLDMIMRFLQGLTLVTAVAVIAVYVASGVIRYVPMPRIARPAIIHLSGIVSVFLLISAIQFRLSIWKLATSTKGVVAGAGWTDIHARIPGYWLMIVASLVLAVVILLYARREKWRIVGGAVIGWVAVSVLLTGVIPSLVQAVLVEPNELDREKPVLKGNIENTRVAFALNKIKMQPFTDEANLSERQLLKDNTDTTDNIRLWSPSVLTSIIRQQQSLRRYYTFNDVDVDRYTVDGKYRQVMVSVRELDPAQSTVASSWTNQRLVYTHGFGAVATWPNKVTTEGQPEYLIRDLPPVSVGQDEIKITRPEVYFGEASDNPAIVGTRQTEISPKSEGGKSKNNVRASSSESKGGVSITSFARKVAFATTFGDARMLFTNQFTPKSRILFRRNIKQRITHLAPFLTLDNDPYAVLVNGRIIWIVDAYTTSDRFPYSEPVHLGETGRRGSTVKSVNYVRNSVKATVDAYSGKVTLYVADKEDPIIHAWMKIFPKLFTSMDKMPNDLRKHIRYPEDLFRLQTDRWVRYHMSNVADFYAREDLWEVPTLDNVEMEPFYVLARLPGKDKAEMLLVRPFTPATRKNMIAYMAARSDGNNYGKVITYQFPTQVQTQGPSQVQALIRQDSDIAEQVRLWESNGNQVLYGNLLVLPIEKSLLYVQPVYLQNEEAPIPKFEKIVVVLGRTVAWGDNFGDAVRNLLAERGVDVDSTSSGDSPKTGNDKGSVEAGDASFAAMDKAELEEILGKIDKAYNSAVQCQRNGDWACYGRESKKIEQLLSQATNRQR